MSNDSSIIENMDLSYIDLICIVLKYKLHYQKDPDICLEATACRLFAAEVSKYIKDSCKSILGGSTFLSDNNVVAIFDDIEGMYSYVVFFLVQIISEANLPKRK